MKPKAKKKPRETLPPRVDLVLRDTGMPVSIDTGIGAPIRGVSEAIRILDEDDNTWARRPYETTRAILLDGALRPMATVDIGRGTSETTIIDLRGLMTAVLLTYARAVIIAHNHPSGCTVPSAADIDSTRTIKRALDTIQVYLMDHVIMAPSGSWSSMRAEGLLSGTVEKD